jgi:hypothetical protein
MTDSLMTVQIVNPLDYPNWDEQVLRFPNYCFFHSLAWARVLSETYRYKPLYFTIFDGNSVSACLPLMEINSFITGKRGTSLPFSDYCEPLAHDTTQFQTLFTEARDYGSKAGWRSVEFRGTRHFLGNDTEAVAYLGHTLDLTPGTLELLAALRDSTRRNMKKAHEAGVEVTITDTMDAVIAFYKLHQVTRKHHGLPPQPFDSFRAIYQHVLAKGLGFVALASYRDKAVAAAVFFQFGRKAIYKYGASVPEHQHRRPNNLLMWKAIEYLSERGLESLCFGRTDTDHDGLRQFKAGWGAEECCIRYHRYDLRQNKFVKQRRSASGLSSTIFRNLPVSVLAIVGSLAYRHIG